MTDPLPRELIVTELPDSVRYCLPRRKAGRFTFQAGVQLLGSLIIGIPFMSFWLWGVCYHIVGTLEKPARSKIAVLETPETLTVTVPPRWFGRRGAVFTISKGELVVVRNKLFDAERHHWSRRQLVDIRVGCIHDSEGPDTPELHIEPHPGEGTRFRLALVDEAEARWLATLLRRALGVPENGSPGQADLFRGRREQPAGSRIVCQESQRRVTLTVPPTGSDVKQRLQCSLIAFSAAALFAALIHFVFDDTKIYFAYSGLGALLGIALLVDAVNRARRRVVLTVADDRLIVRQSGLYGARREQLPRLRIADVRVGDSLDGKAISPHTRQLARDKADPTYELQIHLRNGEIVRFLDGYGAAELQWLATVLRRALAVPEQSPAS